MTRTVLDELTAEDVVRAEREFDRGNGPIEWALTELFRKFPRNTDFREVIVKTKILNVLYSTQIRAVNIVANHIVRLEIDADLEAGKPEVVDRVARVQMKVKARSNFSFATKYCHWHNPMAYPIYDGNVEACLWHYRKQGSFAAILEERDIPFHRYGYDYPEFVRIVNAFRDAHNLTFVSYKRLDKLLWSLGSTLK